MLYYITLSFLEKRIPYKVVKVPMRCYGDKPRSFMQINPSGGIPVAVIKVRVRVRKGCEGRGEGEIVGVGEGGGKGVMMEERVKERANEGREEGGMMLISRHSMPCLSPFLYSLLQFSLYSS